MRHLAVSPSPSSSGCVSVPPLRQRVELAVEVFRALSRPDGGNPSLSLPELQAVLSRALSGPRAISLHGMSVKDALVAEHQFVLERLRELDASASGNDQVFADLPSLTSVLYTALETPCSISADGSSCSQLTLLLAAT